MELLLAAAIFHFVLCLFSGEVFYAKAETGVSVGPLVFGVI